MKKIYNKLVRDKIPEIIKQDGKICEVKILNFENYHNELNKKLAEEMAEYCESGSVEELADIFEVIRALHLLKGVSEKEFEKIVIDKRAERGGFQNKLFLVEVIEK